MSQNYTTQPGSFIRAESVFRNWITPDGKPGPSGEGGFAAESGRFHLIVALTCPWAHRTLIYLYLKGLESAVSLGVVHPQRTTEGWAFLPFPGSTDDTVLGASHLSEYYRRADPNYKGRITVPILWDRARNTIVSNESSDIIRMFNSAFDDITECTTNYYPNELKVEIEEINELIYQKLNNGVYRAGFAKSQSAYELAYNNVFQALDLIELRLEKKQYLLGDRITESDWRLFPTLVRFDVVYYPLFKCNRKRLVDYPMLWAYTKKLYAHPRISETVNLEHIRHGYWRKSERNPSGIIPLGPEINFLGLA